MKRTGGSGGARRALCGFIACMMLSGGLCRAEGENAVEPTDPQITAAAEETPTTAPEEKEPTAAPEKKEPTAAPEKATPTPVQEEKTPTPAPTEEAPAPAPTEEAPTPAPTEEATAPAPTEEATAPATTEEATAPAPTEEATAPAQDTPAPSAAPTAEAGDTGQPEDTPSAAPTEEVSPAPTATAVPGPWTIGKDGVVRRNNTILRAKADKTSGKVKKLDKGDQVRVLSGIKDAGGNVWYLVKYNKKKGYVAADAVTLSSDKDDGSGLIKTKAKRRLDWTGVVEAGEGGMLIPSLYQFDFRTTLCYYGGIPRSVSTSGCNVTCISMVVAYLTGNTDQTPEVMFDWAVDNNLYHGKGLGHDAMIKVAAHWGIDSRWISNSADRITAALRSGYPVIAHMGEGLFTSEGHYIVLRGVTEDGKILVNDPNSESNSGKAFPMSRILDEARLHDSSFMVCYPPEGMQED